VTVTTPTWDTLSNCHPKANSLHRQTVQKMKFLALAIPEIL